MRKGKTSGNRKRHMRALLSYYVRRYPMRLQTSCASVWRKT